MANQLFLVVASYAHVVVSGTETFSCSEPSHRKRVINQEFQFLAILRSLVSAPVGRYI